MCKSPRMPRVKLVGSLGSISSLVVESAAALTLKVERRMGARRAAARTAACHGGRGFNTRGVSSRQRSERFRRGKCARLLVKYQPLPPCQRSTGSPIFRYAGDFIYLFIPSDLEERGDGSDSLLRDLVRLIEYLLASWTGAATPAMVNADIFAFWFRLLSRARK